MVQMVQMVQMHVDQGGGCKSLKDNMWSMWIKYSLTEPVEPVTPFARPKIEPARGRNPHTGHEKWQIFVIYCDGRPSRRSVVAMSSVAWNTR